MMEHTLFRRWFAAVIAGALLFPLLGTSRAAASITEEQLKLPDGRTATVRANAVTRISGKDTTTVEYRMTSPGIDKNRMIAELMRPAATAYAPQTVIVAYRRGVTGTSEVVAKTPVARGASAPAYTSNPALNAILANLGTDRAEHLFRKFRAAGMIASAISSRRNAIDLGNVYKLHISHASVRDAVIALLKSPDVVYASPDWRVAPMHTQSFILPRSILQAARQRSFRRHSELTFNLTGATLPTNYSLTSSEQSLLNAPGTDAAAAFDEIESRFHQMPGTGEIITNVSLGDVDDSQTPGPCALQWGFWGPTMTLINGQHYLDWPSMPLIPAYTSDTSGDLSGTNNVCNVDPFDEEIGLDFSMMAPLPDAQQRTDEPGNGLGDLVGIAPGAQYRLIVPGDSAATTSDLAGAFLGAGLQTPRPNVISASLGFGLDAEGFPSRFLEDDPLMASIVNELVNSYGIVVCISAGDGVRSSLTNVAVGPSGGSAATNEIAASGTPTSLGDIAYSSVPSADFDSGSIDVGGSTLDDIFSNPPQFATSPTVQAQHGYAETRWNGFVAFSSGFGTRVNISAPSDNVVALSHAGHENYDGVDVGISGGTSAAAPEVAAAAAVALQVARLSGHPFANPQALRSFLETNATLMTNVPQADVPVTVGPQIDVRRTVEALLSTSASAAEKPNVPRVAVEQRRNYGSVDTVFISDTDPQNIDLQSSECAASSCTAQALDEYAWVTIAPDWEFMPPGTTYLLKTMTGPKPLATTAWARLQPQAILAAAGMPLVSTSSRTVKLAYTASRHGKRLATTTFSLTFSAAPSTSDEVLAPQVPAVVTGPAIPVTYNISTANPAHVSSPELFVSEPGRMVDWSGGRFHPSYTVPLTGTQGTVKIPVNKLQGGGIYGIGILLDPATVASVGEFESDVAFTRVAVSSTATSSASATAGPRPPAPLLSYNGSTPGHSLTIPYGLAFQVSWNLSNVPGATGGMLEISAPGPNPWNNFDTFNNPNGSIRDNNGIDTGSIFYAPLSGVSGTMTVNAATAGLSPTMTHVVRVIPTNGGAAAGEASDVSSISENGIVPADGGAVALGYGLNVNGLDAFLTSNQTNALGQQVSSLETFNQQGGAITSIPQTLTGSQIETWGWGGVYGNDYGLVTLIPTSGTRTYHRLNPVSSGAWSTWTPTIPATMTFQARALENTGSTLGVFLTYDSTGSFPDNERLYTQDLASGATSPFYDISQPVLGLGYSVIGVGGQAFNGSANQAFVAFGDELKDCSTSALVDVNLTSGAVSEFAGATGLPVSLTVNPSSGYLLETTACNGGFGIYNPATQSGTSLSLPGNEEGLYTAVDTRRGFLVAQAAPSDILTNNNALSAVLEYNYQGTLLETIERFELFNTPLSTNIYNLQVNSATDTGYIVGPHQLQLEPFNY